VNHIAPFIRCDRFLHGSGGLAAGQIEQAEMGDGKVALSFILG